MPIVVKLKVYVQILSEAAMVWQKNKYKFYNPLLKAFLT